jgi:hypothetical protein
VLWLGGLIPSWCQPRLEDPRHRKFEGARPLSDFDFGLGQLFAEVCKMLIDGFNARNQCLDGGRSASECLDAARDRGEVRHIVCGRLGDGSIQPGFALSPASPARAGLIRATRVEVAQSTM